MSEIGPIRSEQDYKNALQEAERLWGAKSGTLKGDRLDVLVMLIDASSKKLPNKTRRSISAPLSAR